MAGQWIDEECLEDVSDKVDYIGIFNDGQLNQLEDEQALLISQKYGHIDDRFVLRNRLARRADVDVETGEKCPPRECEIKWGRRIDETLNRLSEKRQNGMLDDLKEVMVQKGMDQDELDSRALTVDAGLRKDIKQMVLTAQRRNFATGLNPWTDTEIEIFTWECWHTELLFGGKLRNDGSSYSRSHLFGSVMNAINYLGITDLTFLIAVLCHDSYEDLKWLHGKEKKTRKRSMLTAHRYWKDEVSLEDMNLEKFNVNPKVYIRDRLAEIERWGAAVTNMKDEKDVDGVPIPPHLIKKHNFRVFLEDVDKYGFMPALLRLSDRKHNTSTLDGMLEGEGRKPRGKVDLKAIITAKVHAPVSALAGCFDMQDALLGDCFWFAREHLVRVFVDTRELQMLRCFFPEDEAQKWYNKGGEPEEVFHESALKNMLDSVLFRLDNDEHFLGEVDWAGLVPAPVGSRQYFDGLRIDDPTYDPTANIDPMDPMCEIVILVDSPDDVTYVERTLVEVFSPNKLAHVNNEGEVPLIAIPGFNTWVKFRVIDTRSDLLSQSGSIGGRTKDGKQQIKEHLSSIARAALKTTLAETRRLGDETVHENAATHLTDPSITVFTPKGEAIELPRGATVLDFAAKIHQDLLAAMSGAYVRDSSTSSGHWALPTEALKDGQTVNIEDKGESVLHPMHTCFVTEVMSDSAKKVRRALKEGLSAGDLESKGRGFVRELGKMLGLLPKDAKVDNGKLIMLIMSLLSHHTLYAKRAYYAEEREAMMKRMRQIDESVADISGILSQFDDNEDEAEELTLEIARLDAEWEDLADNYKSRDVLYWGVVDEINKLERGEKYVKKGKGGKRLQGKTEVLRDLACGHISPLEILVNSDHIDFGEGLEISVDLPHEDNAHYKFLQAFATDMISFNYPEKILEIFEGEDGKEMGRFLIRLELPQHGRSSHYEILKWVWLLAQRPEYNMQVTSKCFKAACDKITYQGRKFSKKEPQQSVA